MFSPGQATDRYCRMEAPVPLLSDAAQAPDVVAALGPDAERLLQELCVRAFEARPGLAVAPEVLVAHAATILVQAGDVPAALASMNAGDVALAAACLCGDAAALRTLDDELLRLVPSYIAHVVRGPGQADEVTQLVRAKLLVGDGATPGKLADYRGSGPLGGWLRVVAVRTAQNFRRDGERAGGQRLDTHEERGLRAPEADPELEYVKTRYGGALKEAFSRTLAELSEEDRALLSFTYVDGLASDAVAKIYGVHAATIRRRVERLRVRLLEHTRELLAADVGGKPDELDSLIDLVRSRVDVSLSQLLRRP